MKLLFSSLLLVLGSSSTLLATASASESAVPATTNDVVDVKINTTMNFSSSEQVAVASGKLNKGFTFVGIGSCKDGIAGGGNFYDRVKYAAVGSFEDCAKKCSKCPGGGQKDDDGEKLVLRGFEKKSGTGPCACLVDAGATFTESVCKGAFEAITGDGGSGEIESSDGSPVTVECWKITGHTLCV